MHAITRITTVKTVQETRRFKLFKVAAILVKKAVVTLQFATWWSIKTELFFHAQ